LAEQDLRTRVSILAVIIATGAIAIGISSSAVARGGTVALPVTSQGQLLEDGKVPVAINPSKSGEYKTSVSVSDGDKNKKIAKAKATKIPNDGKIVKAKLTKDGKKALRKCTWADLRGKATPVKGNGALSTSAPLTETWAPCVEGSETPSEQPYFGPKLKTKDADRCDFLDPAVCLQPFPNDYFTVADGSTDTGRRVNFAEESMPENSHPTNPNFDPVHISPTDYNRADGFSPGSPINIKVPGMENHAVFNENALVPITDMHAYDDPAQRVVVINADTGDRHPIWAEMDSNPADDADRNLIIRPAVNFDEGGHYIVALRGLTSGGETIAPPLPFKAYRDQLVTDDPAIEDRRDHMEEVIDTLQTNGIQRSNLYMAWDFTVASEESLSSRALAMRDDAFAQLGDTDLGNLTVEGDAPDYTIGTVTNYQPCSAGSSSACETGENDRLLRRVEGTMTAPCYLDTDGCPPGSQFAFDGPSDPFPNFNPSYEVDFPFTCTIPRSVDAGTTIDQARPSLYGHGLLGQRTEVVGGSGGNVDAMANEHNFTFCAADWYGMSLGDAVFVVLPTLQDLNGFPKIPDRSQQGFVDFMYLGRAMIHPDGFQDDAAFQVDPDGDDPEPASSVIDDTRLFYDGNSQGGILGGALTALSPDFNRASLGVPAMNYSTLLQRSVDFDEYAQGIIDDVNTPDGLYDRYPNELERPLIMALMSMLWDRGEANGYAHHMTFDPLPNTPSHEVLMHVAYGDHQVADVAAEVEARTIGASVLTPTGTASDALDPGRHWDVDPFLGIPPITSYPYLDSALVYWDGGPLGFDGTIGSLGTPQPPNGNLPPRTPDGYGDDPHSYPRRDVQARVQKSDFLQVGGGIQGPCMTGPDPTPCYSNGWTGPPGP
jgi:hypothetical protein